MQDLRNILYRVDMARRDRDRHEWWINEALRLSCPTYRRLNDPIDPQDRIEGQDDQFDNELEFRAEDFAADAVSEHTPQHESWVMFEPAEDLTEGQKREVEPQIKAIATKIEAEIQRSNYNEAAQEAFMFWGVSTMACAVSDMGPLNPIHFQVIEIPDLLIERGPDGSLTGRWREMQLSALDQHFLWGARYPKLFPMPKAGQGKKPETVIEGCDRDWSVPGVERWNYRIIVNRKERLKLTYEGQGSCPIIACRFRQQADSAWGPGPFKKATPPARVLDELGYLGLKAMNRAVDPAFSYEEDGLSNFEGGMEPGKGFARAPGSKPPEAFLPDIDFNAMMLGVDDKRRAIRRSCYLNDPEQQGLTPPTLGQWQDEMARNTRRKALPRERVVREWVIPIIERVAWILSQRGEMPEVKLKGGKTIAIRPISPLSKAKDLEDMNITGQVLQMAASMGGALQVGVPIDTRATLENLRRTSKERHIVMKTDEQLAQEAMMQAAAQGALPGAA